MKNKVTKEQVEFWLGSDFKMPEILETLRDLANGDYKQDLLKKYIINTCLSCGFINGPWQNYTEEDKKQKERI